VSTVNLEERMICVTDLTYCMLFSFWYYIAVLEDKNLFPADNAPTLSKKSVSFVDTCFECTC
jgi:hypothetical protein